MWNPWTKIIPTQGGDEWEGAKIFHVLEQQIILRPNDFSFSGIFWHDLDMKYLPKRLGW